MAISMRRSGIKPVGDIAWGTHLCQFYQSPADLIDMVVAYCKAGLEDNELCLVVTSEPLPWHAFLSAMRQQVPAFNDHMRRGNIEIVSYNEWCIPDDTFDVHRFINNFVEKLAGALQHGYEGMRVTGDTAWLDQTAWKDFRPRSPRRPLGLANGPK